MALRPDIRVTLQQPKSPRRKASSQYDRNKNPNDTKEPRQRALHIISRNSDVHPKQPSHHMQRHKDRREDGHLAQARVESRAQPHVMHTRLREEIRLQSAGDFVEMGEFREDRDEVVLDVAEVDDQIASREGRVPPFRLAALHEPVQHVGFAGERVREVVDAFAGVVDLQHQGRHVVVACDVDLVLDCFGCA